MYSKMCYNIQKTKLGIKVFLFLFVSTKCYVHCDETHAIKAYFRDAKRSLTRTLASIFLTMRKVCLLTARYLFL